MPCVDWRRRSPHYSSRILLLQLRLFPQHPFMNTMFSLILELRIWFKICSVFSWYGRVLFIHGSVYLLWRLGKQPLIIAVNVSNETSQIDNKIAMKQIMIKSSAYFELYTQFTPDQIWVSMKLFLSISIKSKSIRYLAINYLTCTFASYWNSFAVHECCMVKKSFVHKVNE